MSTWAIGDVQGCLDALERLLREIAFDPDRDRVWFAGDLVNRGAESLGVLRRVHALGERAVVVLGNHDLHLLAIAAGVRAPSRKDTLDAVLAAPDRAQLIDWLRTRPLVHEDARARVLMVHAGIAPGWSRQQLVARATEVSAALASEDWKTHLAHMYGDTPTRWHDSLAPEDARRLTINVCTRLRIVTPDDGLELRFKGPLGEVPPGCRPWFSERHASLADWRVAFGHWAALGGESGQDWAQALDTGCGWGDRLTAMRLEDGVRVSVPARVSARGQGATG